MLFDREARENLRKTSEKMIEKCNELVKANQENTEALRELRRTLKDLAKKL